MNESASLTNLMQKAFQMAGESVPLGFDVGRIQPTLAKLPGKPVTGLESLFATVWLCDSFHLGRIELFGPERSSGCRKPPVLYRGSFGWLLHPRP